MLVGASKISIVNLVKYKEDLMRVIYELRCLMYLAKVAWCKDSVGGDGRSLDTLRASQDGVDTRTSNNGVLDHPRKMTLCSCSDEIARLGCERTESTTLLDDGNGFGLKL
jgi:hypothetical protein